MGVVARTQYILKCGHSRKTYLTEEQIRRRGYLECIHCNSCELPDKKFRNMSSKLKDGAEPF